MVVMRSGDQSVTPLQPSTDQEMSVKQVMMRSVLEYLGYDDLVTSTTPVTSDQKSDVSEGEMIRRRYSVFLTDLDKTLLTMFSQEIFLNDEDLSSEQYDDVIEFLSILEQLYPPQSSLSEMITKMNIVMRQRSGVSMVRTVLEEYHGVVEEGWEGCQGSGPQYGGYTCGVWTLWHYLTVAQHTCDTCEAGHVLRSMINYVRHFFSCRHCADHFLKMTNNGSAVEEVENTEDAVMFLWEAHNNVTLRLINDEDDQTDDPAFPKQFFPSREFCPKCFDEEDVNKEETLQFLIKHYSSKSIINNSYSSSATNIIFDISLHLLLSGGLLLL